MKHLKTALTTTLALLALPSAASAYEYNGVIWPEEMWPMPIELYDGGIDDLTVEQLEEIVLDTLEEWNRVGCAVQVLEYAGRTDAHIEIDERQSLEWFEDEDIWVYGSMTAGATIIMGFDDPNTPERDPPMVDIAFNGVNFTWSIGGDGIRKPDILDPQAVLTHEIGHLLGLSHTREEDYATMSAAYVPDQGQSTLAIDDKLGLCGLFYSGGSECEVDGDCREGEECTEHSIEGHDDETVKLCAEIRDTFLATCSENRLNCLGQCLFTQPDFSDGYCTDVCEVDDECPCEMACQNIGTPNVPNFICRRLPEDMNRCGMMPEDDAGLMDSGDPMEPDVGTPEPSDDTGAVPDTPEPEGATPPDEPQPKDKDCDCQLAAPASGSGGWPFALLLGFGFVFFRRRKAGVATLAVFCAAGVFSAPSPAVAQDMTFDEMEPLLRTYTVVVQAKRLSKRDQRSIISIIEDSVRNFDGHEVINARQLQKMVGNRSWRKVSRCKDGECYFPYVGDGDSIDRLIVVRMIKDSGFITVDMEYFDVYGQELVRAVPAVLESAQDAEFIDDAVVELLTEPAPEPVVETGPIVIPDDLGDDKKEEDGEGFLQPEWGWYAMAAGGGFIAVGGVFALLADTTQAEIQAAPHEQAALEDLISSGQTNQTVANVMFGLGVTSLITGGVIYYLTSDGEQPAPREGFSSAGGGSDIRVDIGPTGALLTVQY